MKFEHNIKNYLILLLALVVLFIPTFIAIWSYDTKSGSRVDADPSTRVTLEIKTPAADYTATKDDDPDGLWAAFDAIIANATSASIPATAVTDSLLATYVTEKIETDPDGGERIISTDRVQYIFYFTTDYSSCYYKKPDGSGFRIRETDAKVFLQLDASAYLFSGGSAPVLTAFGNVIEAASMKWNYLAAGNTYKTIEKSSSEKPVFTASYGAKLELNFSEQPTSCIIRVYSGNEVLYDASWQSVPPLKQAKNAKLECMVQATWASANKGSPYGDASYTFSIDYVAPVEFMLGSDSIKLGDVTVISAFNATDPSAISFSSVPSLPAAPVFYKTDDACVGLLPVSYGAAAGTYVLTLRSGDVEKKFTLTVSDWKYKYKTATYDVSKAMIETLYTDENLAALAKLESDIASSGTSAVLFSGKFQGLNENNVLLGIGRSVTLTNDTQTPARSFEHSGVDVKAAAGSTVVAMNSGVVLKVGRNEILGNYVVIDHGLGLMTWYEHLGEVDVAEGASVEAGQKIALAGSTGFTKPDRLHIGVSVNGVFVAPYGLCEYGLAFPVFN